jgi:hypothetical protein
VCSSALKQSKSHNHRALFVIYQAAAANPWPLTTQAYVLRTGTIADTNYLAIP